MQRQAFVLCARLPALLRSATLARTQQKKMDGQHAVES